MAKMLSNPGAALGCGRSCVSFSLGGLSCGLLCGLFLDCRGSLSGWCLYGFVLDYRGGLDSTGAASATGAAPSMVTSL